MQQVVQANQVSNVTKEIVIKALESWLRLPLPLSDTKELLVSLIPYSNYGLLCEVSQPALGVPALSLDHAAAVQSHPSRESGDVKRK